MNYNVNILNTLYIRGKGNILLVNKNNYKINDTINNRYLIRGIEDSLHSSVVGLIVNLISYK